MCKLTFGNEATYPYFLELLPWCLLILSDTEVQLVAFITPATSFVFTPNFLIALLLIYAPIGLHYLHTHTIRTHGLAGPTNIIKKETSKRKNLQFQSGI